MNALCHDRNPKLPFKKEKKKERKKEKKKGAPRIEPLPPILAIPTPHSQISPSSSSTPRSRRRHGRRGPGPAAGRGAVSVPGSSDAAGPRHAVPRGGAAPPAAGGVRARAPAHPQAHLPGGNAGADARPAQGEARRLGGPRRARARRGAGGGAADPAGAGGARPRHARGGAPGRGPRARGRRRGWCRRGHPRRAALPLHPVLQAPRPAERAQGLARRGGRLALHLRVRWVPLRALPDPGQD